MVDLHPDKKPRKASELFSELKAVSSVVLPEWNGVQQKGEFGYALLKVLAMLSERTSIGIAKTPLRDAVAFYNYLDVPPQAPQPSIAPLAFLLNDKQLESVYAESGTQVGATTDDKEFIFETTSALKLLPGRLDFLATVDTKNDRIEIVPQNFLEFQPTTYGVSEFNVPTLTNKGAIKLQVEPEEGLTEGDYIQFIDNFEHKAVYRLGAGKDGLFNLIDPLEQQVVANSRIRRVTDFEAFALRNVQRHEFFLGHKEFLNLEQPSQITVIFEPADVAQQLSGNIKWALYGTRVIDLEGNEKTDWHPIIAESAVNGSIVLKKNWAGSVDEVEVNGEKNRWLRAWHDKPILKPELTTPTQTIKFKVKSLSSLDIDRSPISDLSICCISSQDKADNLELVDTTLPVVDKSISQAFHNNSPLPLTTRFFPFGPEPQRFDIFAVAAPEALSKKGAVAYIDVVLSDASIAKWTVCLSTNGPQRIYAIGFNGQLQLLNFKTNPPVWQELSGVLSSDNKADKNASLERPILDPSEPIKATQYAYYEDALENKFVKDIVVAKDDSGQLWFYQYEWTLEDNSFKEVTISKITLPDAKIIDYATPYQETINGAYHVFLFAIVGSKLKYIELINFFNSTTNLWIDVNADVGLTSIEFSENAFIVTVESKLWPKSEVSGTLNEVQYKLIISDKNNKLWIATLKFNRYLKLSIIWTEMFTSNDLTIDPRVQPAACLTDSNKIYLYGAFEKNGVLRTRIIKKIGNANASPTSIENDVVLKAGAMFQVFPTGFGTKVQAVVTGTTANGSYVIRYRDTEFHDKIVMPTDSVDPAPVVIFPLENNIHFLLIGGNVENILIQQLPDPVNIINYHDALVIETGVSGHQWMENPNSDEVVRIPPPDEAKINYKGGQIFKFPQDKFVKGDWDLWDVNASTKLLKEPKQDANQLRVTTDKPVKNNNIIIKNERYVVIAGPDTKELITLDRNHGLTKGTYDTDIVSIMGNFSVKKKHKRTLLEIKNADTFIGDPIQLKFSNESTLEPKIQFIEHHKNYEAENILWVSLVSEWTSEFPVPVPNKEIVVELYVQGTNNLESIIFPRNYQNPELAWEYFDGDGWRRLEKGFDDQTENFARSGIISFPVPVDLSIVDIAGQEDYFIRARLVGGDYGRPIYKVETTPGDGNSSTQAVTVDTSEMFPPEIQKITARYDLQDQRDPEFVFVNNNLTFRDQTQAASTQDAVFNLLMGASTLDYKNALSSGRAIYFGFTHPVNGTLSLFVDALDVEGEQIAIFEALINRHWETVSAADKTRGFRQRGFITVSINRSPTQTRLFGLDRYWLRARLIDGSSAWQPQVKSIYPNAVNVIQAKTIKQELLGSSTGDSRQQFELGNHPVIPESLELRIKENLTQEEKEDLIAEFGDKTVLEYNEIDLDGEWVLWNRVDSFVSFDADDRVYQLDSNTGIINFGSNTRVPPAGRDNIRAMKYRSGGGIEGNVAAYTIKALKSSIRGVDKVLNPVAAAGGTNTPKVAEQITGSPALIRRADRALMSTDIEALLVASSPDIIRARCLFATNPGEPIRVAVAKRGKLYCPVLSLADKAAFNNAVRREAWGALGTNNILIVDPEYIKVSVKLELYAKSVNQIASLKEAVYKRLHTFFNPIDGGPENNGWPFARQLWRSDVLRELSEFEQLDRVLKLELSRIDGKSLSSPLPQTGIICLDENKLEVIVEFDANTCVEDF